HVRRLRRRRRGGARARAGGALPGQLPPPRPGRGGDRGRRLGRGGGPARSLRVRRPRARCLDGARPRARRRARGPCAAGPRAPYYTVIAPGRRGAELEQWAAIKQAASDAILRLGGTITHHHAVGRHHRPWYDRERPAGFAAALAAAKAALDPAGVLNPGVLID